MATTANPMQAVYQRLAKVGFGKTYLKGTILPSWWDDEAATNPAGFAEAVMILSRHLGLDPDSLTEGDARFADGDHVKFKKRASTSDEDLLVSEKLAVQVSRFVAEGLATEPKPLPESAEQIRSEILASRSPWISFHALLDYCWNLGIAVVCVTEFPPSATRMHGFAISVGDRPVIGICWDNHTGWLLFVLAHELGHIVRGHVNADAVLVDERLDRPNEDDAEEREANAFAHELLTGTPDCGSPLGTRLMTGATLALKARETGRRSHIDPGHLALRYGHVTGRWPLANKALKLLARHDKGLEYVREELAKKVDWESLAPEARAFVQRMTLAPVPVAT